MVALALTTLHLCKLQSLTEWAHFLTATKGESTTLHFTVAVLVPIPPPAAKALAAKALAAKALAAKALAAQAQAAKAQGAKVQAAKTRAVDDAVEVFEDAPEPPTMSGPFVRPGEQRLVVRKMERHSFEKRARAFKNAIETARSSALSSKRSRASVFATCASEMPLEAADVEAIVREQLAAAMPVLKAQIMAEMSEEKKSPAPAKGLKLSKAAAKQRQERRDSGDEKSKKASNQQPSSPPKSSAQTAAPLATETPRAKFVKTTLEQRKAEAKLAKSKLKEAKLAEAAAKKKSKEKLAALVMTDKFWSKCNLCSRDDHDSGFVNVHFRWVTLILQLSVHCSKLVPIAVLATSA